MYLILMASFDTDEDHENIIVNKILPVINEVRRRVIMSAILFNGLNLSFLVNI